MAEDVRCQQPFRNDPKALERLENFLEAPALNEREQQGLIKVIEYTYELARNTQRDLRLEAPRLRHGDRLRLMTVVDDLLLPWPVDPALRHELPGDLEAHLQPVGQCIWKEA